MLAGAGALLQIRCAFFHCLKTFWICSPMANCPAGHARALIALEDPELQKDIAQRIIAEDLNVRQTEKLVQEMTKPKIEKAKKLDSFDMMLFKNQLETVEKELEKQFGTKVSIQHGRKKGKIVLEYYGKEELERILELLEKEGK